MNEEQNPELDYIFHVEEKQNGIFSMCGVNKYESIRTLLSIEDAFSERMREGRLICCKKCAKILNKILTSH